MTKFSIRHQRGATLVVATLMLAVLSLLAISSVTTSTVNLRVVANMQAQQNVESRAQIVIENALSNITTFVTPAENNVVDGDFAIERPAPKCIDVRPADGYSLQQGVLAPEDTQWEIEVTVVDSRTGAQATLREGVGVTMLAGFCPL